VEDFAAGGPPSGGGQGFSSPDNLTFDSARNLWVVTDISSSRLNKPNEYEWHGNNAMFMVPTKGPNAGVAFRFATMPIESEGTGPYFTPDERTLFVCVQHPGEETPTRPDARFGDPGTYSSWWPEGNRTTGKDPATPKPSIVVITRAPRRR
jgi:secreted PhoX family phosphatase